MSSGWKKGLYLLGLTGLLCAGWILPQKMKGIKTDVAAEAVQPKEQEEGAVLETRKIALTFDDGPHSVYTEEMLNVLEEAEVPATFFLLGQNIEGREETPEYVRPPFGTWNEGLEENLDLIPVMWTIDTRDWTTQNVHAIVEHVVKNAGDNDIILMHDSYESTVQAAEQIIRLLKADGFEFVTVDEVLFD